MGRARGITSFAAFLIVLALTFFDTTSFAQAPAKSLKDQLVGHWQLLSVSINGTQPYGAAPQGSMFFDASGNYSVIVVTGGRARSIAYFGTFTVNDADSSITMHVAGSSGPNAAGRDQTRTVSFSGDELTLASKAAASGFGGIQLTWKQAN